MNIIMLLSFFYLVICFKVKILYFQKIHGEKYNKNC
jgi:hypothetical protein